MAPVLAYWDIKGLAESIRLLLRYLGIEFEDKRYKCALDIKQSEWYKEKDSLGLDFPNLPYYIDDDIKLTQSNTIICYIASKHGMVPNCLKQKAILNMIQNDVVDIRYKFGMTCYNPDFEKLKSDMLDTVQQKLKYYETYLRGKEWLMGDKINYPDFNLCELLNQLEMFEPTILEKFPTLKAYLKRFENLPQLKTYMASDEFKKRPFFGLVATYRGGK